MKSPILFIVFNRPDTTKRVFESIKKYKPSKLFIAADGPRDSRSDDIERCEEVKKIVSNIDWKCEVKTLFREKNLGCRIAVSSAITWFFENVESGIILEDDCLPNQSFFKFCDVMLSKYENNNRVMHVSGDNYQPNYVNDEESYYFSRYPNIWGWATWRRAWNKYSVNIGDWRKIASKDLFVGFDLIEKLFWSNNFDLVAKNMLDTWDYQWVYTVFNNRGFAIIPKVNLIQNIGFGPEATHTKASSSIDFTVKELVFPLVHLKDIQYNKNKDYFVSRKVFYINIVNVVYQFLKVNKFIKLK